MKLGKGMRRLERSIAEFLSTGGPHSPSSTPPPKRDWHSQILSQIFSLWETVRWSASYFIKTQWESKQAYPSIDHGGPHRPIIPTKRSSVQGMPRVHQHCHIRRGSMKFGARAFSFFLDWTPHLTQFDSCLEYDGTTQSGSDSWTQAPIPIHHNQLTRAPTIPVTSFPAAGHPRQPNPYPGSFHRLVRVPSHLNFANLIFHVGEFETHSNLSCISHAFHFVERGSFTEFSGNRGPALTL